MTCIVGFTDKEKGITYIGGDSLAVGVAPPFYIMNTENKEILEFEN